MLQLTARRRQASARALLRCGLDADLKNRYVASFLTSLPRACECINVALVSARDPSGNCQSQTGGVFASSLLTLVLDYALPTRMPTEVAMQFGGLSTPKALANSSPGLLQPWV